MRGVPLGRLVIALIRRSLLCTCVLLRTTTVRNCRINNITLYIPTYVCVEQYIYTYVNHTLRCVLLLLYLFYEPSILFEYIYWTTYVSLFYIFPLCSSPNIDEANRKYNTHRCAVYQSDVRRAPRVMTMSHWRDANRITKRNRRKNRS